MFCDLVRFLRCVLCVLWCVLRFGAVFVGFVLFVRSGPLGASAPVGGLCGAFKVFAVFDVFDVVFCVFCGFRGFRNFCGF